MKKQHPHSFPGFISQRKSWLVAALLATTFMEQRQASADLVTWTGTQNVTWTTTGNWDGGVAPRNNIEDDVAVFNQASYTFQPNAGTTSVAGLNFSGTGPVTLTAAALTLGAEGISVQAGAGAASIAGLTRVSSSQTWTNDSSSLLTLGNINSSDTVNPATITFGGSGTGGYSVTGTIQDGSGSKPLGVVIATTGGGVVAFQSISGLSYTGGTEIQSGALRLLNPGVTGTVTMKGGELQLSSNTSFATYGLGVNVLGESTLRIDKTVAGSQNMGVLTLNGHKYTVTSGTLAGAVTQGVQFTSAILNNSTTLEIANPDNGGLTTVAFGGVSLGANDLTFSGGGTVTSPGVFSGAGRLILGSDFTGKISLTNTAQTFGGVDLHGGEFGVGNATSLGTGRLNLYGGSIAFGPSGTLVATNVWTLHSGTATFLNAQSNGQFVNLSGAGLVADAATLRIDTAQVLTLSGLMTLDGDLTLSGTQSATLSGGITFSEDRAIISDNTRTIASGITVSGAVTGTGDLTIKANNIGNMTFSTGGINHTGALRNEGTGSGSVYLNGVIGSNVTSVIQNSSTSALSLGGNNATGAFTTEVRAGTLFLGHASAAATSPIQLGVTPGEGDIALRTSSSLTIANNITVGSESTGEVLIGSVMGANGGFNSTYSGEVTLGKDVVLESAQGNVTFNNVLSGAGGVIIRNTGLSTDSAGNRYGIGGGIVILGGTNTFEGNVRIESGMLQVNGSSGTVDNRLGVGTEAVVIGAANGGETAALGLQASNLTLSRSIQVAEGSGGLGMIGTGIYSGPITLGKTLHTLGSATFSGGISKDGSLDTMGVGVVVSAPRGGITTFSASNTYDGGTIVEAGTLFASAAGALGSGNVSLYGGGLTVGHAQAIATGKKVFVGKEGIFSVSTAALGTQSFFQSVMDSTSSGAIGLGGGATYSSALDLSTIGNGLMYLGAESRAGQAATYSATTLGANSDNKYRLGYGGNSSLLTISNGVLVDGDGGVSREVIIGGPAGLASSSSNGGGGMRLTYGSIYLTGTNNYSGGTTVNSYSTLIGLQATTGGASPFGSGTVTLNNGTLQLNANGASAVTTTIPELIFGGNSTLIVTGSTGTNTLSATTLTRRDRGTLTIYASTGTLGGNARVQTGSTLPTFSVTTTEGSRDMLAPYFTDNNGNFLAYGANGFESLGTAFTDVSAGASNVNAFVRTTTANGLTQNTTVGALVLGANVTSDLAGDRTLTIASGGLSTHSLASVNIGSSSNRIALDFNNKEAIINVNGNPQNQNGLLTVRAIQNADGITKSGQGTLMLADATSSSFVGPITINRGQINIVDDGSLGAVGSALGNDVVLNGGALWFTKTTTPLTLNAARDITLKENGGALYLKVNGNGTMTNLAVEGKVTGTGAFLNLASDIPNSVMQPGYVRFNNIENDFVAPILVGAIAETVGRTTLAYSHDGQLGHASNSISLIGGSSVLRYEGSEDQVFARDLGFLSRGGNVEVLENVTLTLSGEIFGSGMFNKLGNGRLHIDGVNRFEGITTVHSGILSVASGSALGVSSAVVAGSLGVSGGTVNVLDGATLEFGTDGGGSFDKQLILSGSGVSGVGALHHTGGTTSNAGGATLVGNTRIGVDSGTLSFGGKIRGTFGLEKAGSGELVLRGANTYSGITHVRGGRLVVNGTNSILSSMQIHNGAVLSGTGDVRGNVALNAGGTLDAGLQGSVGTLKVGSINAASTGTFLFDFVDDTADRITANSSVALGGANLTFNATGSQTLGRYTVLQTAGSISGAFGTTTGLDSKYRVDVSTSKVDVVHKASIAISGTTYNAMVGTDVDLAFNLQNVSPTSGDTLSYSLTGDLSGTGTVVSGGSQQLDKTVSATLGESDFTVGVDSTGTYAAINDGASANGKVIGFQGASLSGSGLDVANASGSYRAAAKIATATWETSQSGFAVNSVSGSLVGAGNSVGLATFNSTGKLNGTYSGSVAVTYENRTGSDEAILGNTSGSATVGVTTSVTGHSSAQRSEVFTANVLAGQSFGSYDSGTGTASGYSLQSGAGKGTTAQFIGGVASETQTISLSFDSAPTIATEGSVVSDWVTVGGLALSGDTGEGGTLITKDHFVLQLSYVGTSNEFTAIVYVNGDGVMLNAIAGNSGNTGEYFGDAAYSGQLALGSWGYDSSTNTAWAVLNHSTDFAVVPEPSTYLMLLGGFGLLSYRVFRRRSS